MFYAKSAVDTLLDSLNVGDGDQKVTLLTFLDEDDTLSECRANNKRLMEYFCRDENLSDLVTFTVGGSVERDNAVSLSDDNLRKYATISGDILSSDDAKIALALVKRKDLVDRLCRVIEKTPKRSLSTPLANNVTKVLVSLLRVQNVELLTLLQARKSFLSSILDHVGISSVADLLIRLLEGPESERHYGSSAVPPKQEAIEMLKDANVLTKLGDIFVEYTLSTSTDERSREDILAHVSDVLIGMTTRVLQMAKMFIQVPSDLNLYSNPTVVARMVEAGVKNFRDSDGARYSSLVYALQVATELLTTEANEVIVTVRETETAGRPPFPSGRPLRSIVSMSQVRSTTSSWDTQANGDNADESTSNQISQRPVIPTTSLEEAYQGFFEELVNALMQGKCCDSLQNTTGVIQEPLGRTRLKIVEFFVACLKKGNAETVNALDDLNVPGSLLDIFWKYEWNSMLHNTVSSAIVCALEGDAEYAQTAWLGTDLVPKLISKWDEETTGRTEENGETRHTGGHLGHIILLAGAIEAFLQKNNEKKHIFMDEEELAAFEEFCNAHLEPARQREATVLGGVPPGGSTKSESSDVVEENTDVFDVEGLVNDLPAAELRSSQNKEDSDEDEVEVEVVDTDLPVEELSRAVGASKSTSTPAQPQLTPAQPQTAPDSGASDAGRASATQMATETESGLKQGNKLASESEALSKSETAAPVDAAAAPAETEAEENNNSDDSDDYVVFEPETVEDSALDDSSISEANKRLSKSASATLNT